MRPTALRDVVILKSFKTRVLSQAGTLIWMDTSTKCHLSKYFAWLKGHKKRLIDVCPPFPRVSNDMALNPDDSFGQGFLRSYFVLFLRHTQVIRFLCAAPEFNTPCVNPSRALFILPCVAVLLRFSRFLLHLKHQVSCQKCDRSLNLWIEEFPTRHPKTHSRSQGAVLNRKWAVFVLKQQFCMDTRYFDKLSLGSLSK